MRVIGAAGMSSSRYWTLDSAGEAVSRRVVTTDGYCTARAAIVMPDALRVAEELEQRAVAQPEQTVPLRNGISTIVSRRFGSCPAHRLLCLYDGDTVILLRIGPIADSLLRERSRRRGDDA